MSDRDGTDEADADGEPSPPPEDGDADEPSDDVSGDDGTAPGDADDDAVAADETTADSTASGDTGDGDTADGRVDDGDNDDEGEAGGATGDETDGATGDGDGTETDDGSDDETGGGTTDDETDDETGDGDGTETDDGSDDETGDGTDGTTGDGDGPGSDDESDSEDGEPGGVDPAMPSRDEEFEVPSKEDLYEPSSDDFATTDDVIEAAEAISEDGDATAEGETDVDAGDETDTTSTGTDTDDDAVQSPVPPDDEPDLGPVDADAETVEGTDGGTIRRDDDVRPVERDYGGEEPTAPDDEEMPLAEHVEEMALRVLAVGLVMFGIAGIALFYSDDLINFLWYSFLGPGLEACPGLDCPRSARPRVYHPLSLVLARLKVSTMVGFVLALPVAVYQTYRFMRPGLYPRERRYYLAAVPTSLVLAGIGVAVAYFAVLPSLFSYFATYSEEAAELAFGLTETFNLIVLMLGFFALIFQIPLLVMLAIMMGITTRQWLADRRLYFWGAFAAIAFVFSPDPTGMAPLIVAVTMIALFDGTLLLLRWVGSGSLAPTADGLAARRPYAYVAAALAGYLASPAPVPTGYYDLLPAIVRETLAFNDLVAFTPALIALGLIGLFEVGAYLLRQYGHSRRALKARLAVDSARIPVWLLAVLIGYLGSPDPVLLEAAAGFALPLPRAAAVAVGLAVAYEVTIQLLRWREGRSAGSET